MTQRLTLPLVLLAVLLAAGAFFWSTGEGRRPAPTPRAAEPTATAAEPTASALSAPGQAQAGEEAQPVRAPRDVLDAPAPAAQPESEGPKVAVTGRVLDRFGAPIAKAKVTLAAQTGFPIDLELDRQLPWLKRQRTESDAQGRFRFDGVEPGTSQVLVRAAGFAPFEAQGLVVAQQDTELEPFELTRGAILSGVVVDPEGRGVAGAKIVGTGVEGAGEIFFVGRREPSAVTASDGSFRIDVLACGPWRFVVTSEDHPDFQAEGVAEEPGVELSGLRWQLAPGATIAGTVTGIPAGERGKLEVRAQRGGGDDFFGPSRGTSVEANGSFVVRGLEPGQSYTLKARRARDEGDDFGFFERSRSTEVQARSGESGVVLAYQPEGALVFTVVDARTRQPLEHLRIEAGIEWPAPQMGEDGKPRTLYPGGVVRVGNLRPATASERVTLNLFATGYQDWSRSDLALRAGQELDLGVIALEPVPLVRVRVTEAKGGAPVAGATVRITKEQSGEGLSVRRSIAVSSDGGAESIEFGEGRNATTDADGWAELSSFEGDTVTVAVRAKGHAPYRFPGLFLPRGESLEHRAELTLGGEVLVTVLDAAGQPLRGAQVEHRAPTTGDLGHMRVLGGPGGPGERSDDRGVARFSFLEAGAHSFRLAEEGGGGGGFFTAGGAAIAFGGGAGGDEGWTEVQVGEGATSEITLQASPRGGLEGRVREAGKALAGATLTLEKENAGDGPGFLLPGMDGGPTGKSDGDGRYRIADVKEGRYRLKVDHPTRRMPQFFPLEIRAGDNTFDVELALSILEGRVVDSTGKGVPGVRVWPERQSSEDGPGATRGRMIMIMDDGGGGGVVDSGQFGQRALTDAEGRYSLRGVESDVDLVVKAEGDAVQPGTSEVVRVAPDEVRTGIDLELDPAGSIRVEAKLADGSPGRFQLVQATYLDPSEPPLEPKVSFLQSGSTILKGLKPGRWKVNVRSAQGGLGGSAGQDQEILVKPAEEAVAPFTVE